MNHFLSCTFISFTWFTFTLFTLSLFIIFILQYICFEFLYVIFVVFFSPLLNNSFLGVCSILPPTSFNDICNYEVIKLIAAWKLLDQPLELTYTPTISYIRRTSLNLAFPIEICYLFHPSNQLCHPHFSFPSMRSAVLEYLNRKIIYNLTRARIGVYSIIGFWLCNQSLITFFDESRCWRIGLGVTIL